MPPTFIADFNVAESTFGAKSTMMNEVAWLIVMGFEVYKNKKIFYRQEYIFSISRVVKKYVEHELNILSQR